jgi:hypothetical protein
MSIEAPQLYGTEELTAGKIASHIPDEMIVTKIAEGAILFGRALVRGTAGDQAKIPASASDEFVGVAGRSIEAADLDDEAYADEDPVACVETGVVMVHVEEAVDPGDPVRIRHTAATGKVPGSFCTTADNGKTAVLDGAEFAGSTSGAGLVPLHVKGLFALTADTQ